MNRAWMFLSLVVVLVACAPIPEDREVTHQRIATLPAQDLRADTHSPSSPPCRNIYDDRLVALIWEQWFMGFSERASHMPQRGVTPPTSGSWTPFAPPSPLKLRGYIRQWGWTFPIKEVSRYMTASDQFSVSHTVEMRFTGLENFVSTWRRESDGWTLLNITAGYLSEPRMGRGSRTVTAFWSFSDRYDYDVNIYLTCAPTGTSPSDHFWSDGDRPERKEPPFIFGCVDPERTIRIYRDECGSLRCQNVIDCTSYRIPYLF